MFVAVCTQFICFCIATFFHGKGWQVHYLEQRKLVSHSCEEGAEDEDGGEGQRW